MKKGVKVNATCVTSFTQGVVAANIGCSYVSFFWGRMTDADIDAQKIVNNFRNLLDKKGLSKNVEILVGSLRHQGVISEAYIAGADIVTIGVIKYPDPAVDINPFAKDGTTFDTPPVTVPIVIKVFDPV